MEDALAVYQRPLDPDRPVVCLDETSRQLLGELRPPRLDFAACVKDLVDVHDPTAERIVLVRDQLNTHSPASLYAAFPPAEAKRLTDKLEIHHTPKHGSWLTMAERELSVPQRHCLRQRLADRAAMAREVGARAAQRPHQTDRLAVHHRRCPHHTPPALPCV